MSDGATSTGNAASSVSVKWSVVAGWSSLLALASLVTLGVISGVKDVDVLSTVALALAILAFVIQIIVFVVQSWTSGQQVLQSQSINAETTSLLREVRESARGTNSLVQSQFDKVLDHLMATTTQTVRESGGRVDSIQLRKRLENSVREALGPDWVRPASPTDGALEKALRTFPKDENQIRRGLEYLSELSPLGVAGLRGFIDDEIDCLHGNGRPGHYDGVERPVPWLGELRDKGFIEPGAPAPEFAAATGVFGPFYVLSEKGRQSGRLVRAAGEIVWDPAGPPAEVVSALAAAKESQEG